MNESIAYWLVGSGLVLAGFVIGVIIGRLLNPDHRRLAQLQQQLAASRSELASYERRVTDHFARSAQLFNNLSKDYESVYRHLAGGCQDLCREHPPRLLNGESPLERLRTDDQLTPPPKEPPDPSVVPLRKDEGMPSEGLGIG